MAGASIEVTINGQKRQVREGETVFGLLESLALDPARVAVELDREILSKPLWKDTTLRGGAQLEIVQFVGGG